MNWSLEHYNPICYGSSALDIFKDNSGSSSFIANRLFEHTSDEAFKRFEENIGSLSELPALVVAEVENPSSKTSKPAFLTQIRDVRKGVSQVSFSYNHLAKLTSEEVFKNTSLFDLGSREHCRTHWAVKQGDLVSKLFKLLNDRDDPNLPKLFDIETWPLPKLNHVAVMMPFSAEFNSVYKVIKDVCKKAGCPTRRIDEIYGPRKIISDVFSTIAQCQLVICDLTGRNPNVLYETGLAHALGRDVILLTQTEEDVPFDLRQIRFIKYLPNKEGLESLSSRLEQSLDAALNKR